MDKRSNKIHVNNSCGRMDITVSTNKWTENTIIDNTMVSFEKQYLVLTIKLFYSKKDTLPAMKQKWFEHDESEYSKLLVTIKQ